MRWLKTVVPVAGIALLILAATCIYVSWQGLSEIRPADSYEDRGIRTFVPYDVLPVQVKNTSASSRDRRMNPTRTVYKVYYRADDGSGYRWSEEVLSRSSGQKIVEAGEPVERRVLSIPQAGTYITVEPDQTAEGYTTGLRERYTRIILLSALYCLLYGAAHLVLWMARRRREEQMEQPF